MLLTILVGAALIATTTLIHGIVTSFVLGVVRGMHVGHWVRRSQLTRGGFQAGLVLVLFLASLLEAAIWGVVYLRAGVIESFEQALYFSVVTYTTLGYGDVTLPEQWRLLGAFQAAAGIVIFGWSTAILVASVQRVYLAKPRSSGAAD